MIGGLKKDILINKIKFGNDENEIYITYSNFICKYRK